MKDNAGALDAVWTQLTAKTGTQGLERVRHGLEIFFGEREAVFVDPRQEMRYRMFLPDLPTTPWFDPDRFGWASSLEEHFASIDGELSSFIHTKPDLEPFDPNPDGTPRHAIGWSQYLIKSGDTKFAKTLELLRPVVADSPPGRIPLFSVLKPDTSLRAHVDPGNFLVTCHLGIDIPDGCGLAVADETRTWERGKTVFFDNSFMHSAWNHSDRLRIILLLRVWHPGVTPIERAALTALDAVMSPLVTKMRDAEIASRGDPKSWSAKAD